MVRPDNIAPSQRAATNNATRTDSAVVWPDPSPLASWWQQVMQPGSSERSTFEAV
ncbi:hypothetical protein DFR70_108166 [Nocardia tenerifensis]|uniref:Uncharacterized protein n=1 Tax=Nocardia tenerifensis TaxID=228006 RepID=A0A318JXC7_9NOCA|nr:hypothetical protein [Nocardia tenerifensis]PXX61608.1 hypothetical protein DFR70_108166 [Nocardia tenerifensis]